MAPALSLMPRDAAEIRQIGLPVQARPRRLTQGRVAAVCTQLGEHVSVRNVQRVLGGSLRDVAPMVRKWREDRSAVDTALASDGGGDATQALGAIVLAAIKELGESLAAREPAAAPAESPHLVLAMRRLQETLDRQRPAAGVAQQSAVDAQFRSLAARLDVLARKADAVEVAAPAPVDPLPVLERLEAGLARITQQLAVQDQLTARRLDTQREALASDLADLRNAIPPRESVEALSPAVHAIEERQDALMRSLRARGALPGVRKTLQTFEARLDGMEAVLVRLTGQWEAAARRRRTAKTRVAPRKAVAIRPAGRRSLARPAPARRPARPTTPRTKPHASTKSPAPRPRRSRTKSR